MKKEHVKLSTENRKLLNDLLKKGSLKAKTYKRITALLELDKGSTKAAVAKLVGFSYVVICNLVARYNKNDVSCIYDAARPGRPIGITQEQKDAITVLACTSAPEGYAQWSLSLLADKVVELDCIEKISRSSVNNILKKKNKTTLD